MCVALREGSSWSLGAPEAVGPTSDLFQRLRARVGGPVLVGFDFPIGLPLAYAERTGLSGLMEALRSFGTGRWSDWYRVCENPEEVGIARPFYPARPGNTSRAHLYEGLGVRSIDELLRECDRATPDRRAAGAIFWTLGGQQVGKATIAGWREVIVPNLDSIAIWPFAGRLSDLLAENDVVVAETYPADGYRHVGIPKALRWSKTDVEGRRSVSAHLQRWIEGRPVKASAPLREEIRSGFADDDSFDAFVGLCTMLDVVDGRRPEGAPDSTAVRTWEGWILGQGQLATG
jgi:hypothetical protein